MWLTVVLDKDIKHQVFMLTLLSLDGWSTSRFTVLDISIIISTNSALKYSIHVAFLKYMYLIYFIMFLLPF